MNAKTYRANKERSNPEGRAYNCQILDFFFSVRAGFSLEALHEEGIQKSKVKYHIRSGQ